MTALATGQPRALARRAVLSTPVLLVTLWLLWGSGLVSIKFGLRQADPMAFAALRVATTTLLLGAAVALSARALPGQGRATRRGAVRPQRLHRWALGLGLSNVGAFFTAQNLGMVEAGAGLSAVLLYTQPFMVAIAARALLGERFSKRKILGLLLGWSGVAVLVLGELGAGTTPLSSMALLLFAAFAWTIGTVLFKRMPDMPLIPMLFWMNVYAVVPLIAIALIQGGEVTWGPQLYAATVWAGVAAGIGGMGLNFVLLRRGEATVVSSWVFAVPVVTAAMSVVVLGEPLHPRLFFGGTIVAAGIALVNWSGRAGTSPDPILGITGTTKLDTTRLETTLSTIGPDTTKEDTMDPAIQAVVDKQAIHDTLMRYCRGVDRCDEDLIRSAYHPDAIDEHGIYASNGWEFAKTIVAAKLAETNWCVHAIANHYVELHGDAALSEASFVSYQQKLDDDRIQILGGRYVDRFERRDGEWRIARRLIVHDWSGSTVLDPWSLETVPPELFVQGGRGENDVVTGSKRRELLGL